MKHDKSPSKETPINYSESSVEDQLTDEQREALESNEREHSIEKQRSDYEGFVGDQR